MAATSEYQVFETDEFTSKLEALPAREARAIRAKLHSYVYPQIRVQPFYGANSRKLRGFTPSVWRYRIGKYRIFYTVEEDHRVVSMHIDRRKAGRSAIRRHSRRPASRYNSYNLRNSAAKSRSRPRMKTGMRSIGAGASMAAPPACTRSTLQASVHSAPAGR